ncbi:MAG: hypothetical protein ACD_4C00122G0001, partial [uncultured bacterium (gcode 4)]
MKKVWFFWTPYLARRVLEDLLKGQDIQVSFVVTWADKHVWRWMEIKFNPVKEFALEKDLPIYQIEKI